MPRIEVLSHPDDGRAKQIEKALNAKGKKASVRVVDVYTSENEKLNASEFISSVSNPVTQQVNAELKDFDWALEIANRQRAETGEEPVDINALPMDDRATFASGFDPDRMARDLAQIRAALDPIPVHVAPLEEKY